MNEFERKLLDVVKYTSYIASFADPNKKVIGIDGYTYTVDALAANISVQNTPPNFNLIMDSDSDFVVCYMSAGAHIPAGPVTPSGTRCVEFSPSLLLQITDQSSGKTWFNQPTPVPLVCGAMGFPFLPSSPRVIRPRTTLTISPTAAVDLGGARVFSDFYFALSGAKIYYE